MKVEDGIECRYGNIFYVAHAVVEAVASNPPMQVAVDVLKRDLLLLIVFGIRKMDGGGSKVLPVVDRGHQTVDEIANGVLVDFILFFRVRVPQAPFVVVDSLAGPFIVVDTVRPLLFWLICDPPSACARTLVPLFTYGSVIA